MSEQFEERPLVAQIVGEDLLLICLSNSGFVARPCKATVVRNFIWGDESNPPPINPQVAQSLTNLQNQMEAIALQLQEMTEQRLQDLASNAEALDELQERLTALSARLSALEGGDGSGGFTPPQLGGVVDLRTTPLADLRLTSYQAMSVNGTTAQNADFLIEQDSQVGLRISRSEKNWNGVINFSNVGGVSNSVFEMIVSYHYSSEDPSSKVQAMPGLMDPLTDLARLRDSSAISMLHLGQWLDARANRSAESVGLKAMYWKEPTARRGYSYHDPISGTELPLAPNAWAKLSYHNGGTEGNLCRLVRVTGSGGDLFAESEETSDSLEWYSRNPNRAEYLTYFFPLFQSVEGELRVLAVKTS